MAINEYELNELLQDEIYKSSIQYDEDDNPLLFVEFGNFEDVTLEYVGGQEFFIYDSNTDEMFPGETISVDEILDIVLRG